MRIIIFCAIILFVSFGASAQDDDHARPVAIPPQYMAPDAVTLDVIGNTPAGKRDLTHHIVFPKSMPRDEAIDACAKELAEFLKHKFPDQIELKARIAMCIVPEVMGEGS